MLDSIHKTDPNEAFKAYEADFYGDYVTSNQASGPSRETVKQTYEYRETYWKGVRPYTGATEVFAPGWVGRVGKGVSAH